MSSSLVWGRVFGDVESGAMAPGSGYTRKIRPAWHTDHLKTREPRDRQWQDVFINA
jgi:hypothetical protein